MDCAGHHGSYSSGAGSNSWDCLNVWRDEVSTRCAWGSQQSVDERLQCLNCEVQSGHEEPFRHDLQGLQPYVNVNDYHESPFPWTHEEGNFGIDLGVDHAFSILYSSRAGMSHERMATSPGGDGSDVTGHEHTPAHDQSGTGHLSKQMDREEQDHQSDAYERQQDEAGEGAEGALCSSFSERPGLPGPANDRTPEAPSQYLLWNKHDQDECSGGQDHLQCLLLGGGKRAKVTDEDAILEDEIQCAERTTPGHLKNRLVVLQERALEAIQALPIQCEDDIEFGQVETRVWGLEALKHVLRMRLALQSNLMLCRPVEGDINIPPAIELMAANLTLCIHNKGNRCYANSVMRMWCWMGAHHKDPAAFWGPSTKLCMQLLQQDEIEDIFWASEMQHVIARLDKPQQQHDASEFLVLMWELWGQTGLQGNWVSKFGGRDHEFDTIPIFVRMPPDLGEEVQLDTGHSTNVSMSTDDADWARSSGKFCVERSHITSRSRAHQWSLHHNVGGRTGRVGG